MSREQIERRGGHPGGERDHKNRPKGWVKIVHDRVKREDLGGYEPTPMKLLELVYGLEAFGKWSELEQEQKLQELIEVIDQPGILPVSERACLKARFWSRRSYAEISLQMGDLASGSNYSTVGEYLRRAIDKLSWELAVLKDQQSFRELFFTAVGPGSLDWSADEVLSAVEKLRSHQSEFSNHERFLLDYRYGLSGTIMTLRQITEMFGVLTGTLGVAHRTLLEKIKRILEND